MEKHHRCYCDEKSPNWKRLGLSLFYKEAITSSAACKVLLMSSSV